MEQKKKYESPQVFKIQIDPSQAILSVCHARARRIRKKEAHRWKVCSRRCKHDRSRRRRCNSSANS